MSQDDQQDGTGNASVPSPGEPRKALSPAAMRALAEAEARRTAMVTGAADAPPEHGGRKGPEPTRFGDWEKKGIICDF